LDSSRRAEDKLPRILIGQGHTPAATATVLLRAPDDMQPMNRWTIRYLVEAQVQAGAGQPFLALSTWKAE